MVKKKTHVNESETYVLPPLSLREYYKSKNLLEYTFVSHQNCYPW